TRRTAGWGQAGVRAADASAVRRTWVRPARWNAIRQTRKSAARTKTPSRAEPRNGGRIPIPPLQRPGAGALLCQPVPGELLLWWFAGRRWFEDPQTPSR